MVVFNPNPTSGNEEGRTESECEIIEGVEFTGREERLIARVEIDSCTRES